MRARIWGSRGSLAAPGPETVRYGGNTSCVEVRLANDTLLILDAGTGIRPLGVALGADVPRRIHLFLSHLHLDHLQGLPFFGPLWNPDVEIHIWGPPSPTRTLEQSIARYLSPPLFPVHLQDVPCRLRFHDARGDLGIEEAVVRAMPVSHQGPTVGIRIESEGRILAYIPDHEPGLAVDLRAVEPAWISGHGVARGADVLIHDSQYTEDEYLRKVGWGHSSLDHVVQFARIADVGQLVMFHHDPLHTDDELERMLDRARELWGERPNPPVLAHEGMDLDLSALPKRASA
ncbi:MAG TPA: MBL fold metallo-hydrolase [Actinomycetota bacterium]|nr:MBL fold metallo-hydrolase [Actinomycetota bacterium]